MVSSTELVSSRTDPRAITVPPSTITTVSARSSASSMRWVVSTMLTPSDRSSRIRSHTAWRLCGSIPALGSSRNTSSGRPMIAAARASRWRCPPDRRRTVVRANEVMPRRSASGPTSSGVAYIEARWRSISSGRTPVGSPPSWSMTPTRGRRARASRCGSSPRTRTVPLSGTRSPSQHSIVVVLPAPFGPRTAVTWPAGAVRSSPETTARPL